jgi:hypothetical protein
MLPTLHHFRDRRVCWSFRMGTKQNDKHQLFTQTYINQITSWLVRSVSVFGARMNHKQTWIHKTPHGPDLEETTTFPLIVYFVLRHRISTQMGVSKFPKLGLLQL